jgi:hypothetical protein
VIRIGWQCAAVDAVYSFLCHHRVHSTALYILANALRELGDGVSRPEFKPLKACGRKEDSKSIVSLKGRLAGLGYAYMKSGMARDQAASQVARKIDREIAAKLCAKSLTAQIVKEWMVRYGGSRALRRRLEELHCIEEVLEEFQKTFTSDTMGTTYGTYSCLLMLWLSLPVCPAGRCPLNELTEIAMWEEGQFLGFMEFASGKGREQYFSQLPDASECWGLFGILSRNRFHSNKIA